MSSLNHSLSTTSLTYEPVEDVGGAGGGILQPPYTHHQLSQRFYQGRPEREICHHLPGHLVHHHYLRHYYHLLHHHHLPQHHLLHHHHLLHQVAGSSSPPILVATVKCRVQEVVFILIK
jgi:hypothetical protein